MACRLYPPRVLTMREFFRGWRRRTGCVVLLLACVAMVGWMN
ncbi:MAG TPA: hypothetical protein VGM98_14105 [Schlesneria sp.]